MVGEKRMVANRFVEVRRAIVEIAAEFAEARSERSMRRTLEPADFARLAGAGFLSTGVPVEQGGLWKGLAGSVREYTDLIRVLAEGDPCVALVAAMHPSVMSFWLAGEASPADRDAWAAQRARFIGTAQSGHWWGTMISEPGSGGDILQTRARAEADGSQFRLSGEKHFASGSGITSFMITTGRVDGANGPDLFVVDMRGRPWDATAGLALRTPWNGHGMIATQSHAFVLDRCPAERAASREAFAHAVPVVSQLTPLLFAAVIVGVLRNAIDLARKRLQGRIVSLKAFEQVTWVNVTNGAWLAEQAYEGALRAVETNSAGLLAASRAKATIALLAEQALGELARVLGGASYAREAPFGQWAEDVRALGFLRPPWGLAYEQLLKLDLAQT
jgi:alkylation response protein AidB-like acyl-CoA dehydrogenase